MRQWLAIIAVLAAVISGVHILRGSVDARAPAQAAVRHGAVEASVAASETPAPVVHAHIAPQHERSCATYQLECVPGTSPAAGRLLGTTATPPDEAFCRGEPLPAGRQREKCECPAEPLKSAARPGSRGCDPGATFVTYQCTSTPLLPPSLPPRTSSSRDVLLVVSECYGHGLFAQLERVLNQLRYADSRGMVPAVYLGERVFTTPDDCLSGLNGYWDSAQLARRGLDSVWDYYFEPVSEYRLGSAQLPDGSPVGSVQVVSMPLLYKDQMLGGFDDGRLIMAYGRTDRYDEEWWRVRRRTAHRYLSKYVRVRAELRERARLARRGWEASAAAAGRQPPGAPLQLLGVHLRGTDKVVRKKVPPERYYQFVDAYTRAFPHALVFVATDDPRYLRFMRHRYGERVVYRQAGYRSSNIILDRSLSAYEKGADAIIDALLLSTCDFLIKTTSALSEFAIWLNLTLHERHIDLQFEDDCKTQHLPPWAINAARR